MTTCPSCGQENPDGFRFCGACGTALAEAMAPREERKVVTVLFCDLVGSTARAEQLDPEDVRALLARYHDQVRAHLERYGGTVEKFIGDAVMALFGAPIAHEDDPERAVRAALAIRGWAHDEGDIQVRIGITTGEALVSLGARPERGEGMAAGDVVNTAARLQGGAAVDGILVDEVTYRATRDQVEFREVDAVVAKGKAEPIPAWEAVDVRSRLGLDVGESTATPLIGRGHELELLSQAFERVRADRAVELVTLVGEPGIGKSRLVLELFRRLEADAGLTRWRQGRCLPYGDGAALWALGEIVKAEAGVLETDSADEAGTKLAAAVARTIHAPEEAAWVEGHLRPLVGLGSEAVVAGERRDEAFVAWRRYLEGVAEAGPLVVVFEDLHWADDTLLDFVDHLVDWAADVPLLVLAIARPELLARRPGWGGGRTNATTRAIAPLSDDDTAALVHALLGRSVMEADTQRSLIANAGGNPLYAEEFARMLEERGGAGADGLPESVQGIIAARLDSLQADDKALVQDAAVLGKVFWLGALAAISGQSPFGLEQRLHELERRELIRRDRASAVADERQYAFRHVLVRDVAYGQIPKGRRSAKHVAVAEWIERLGSERTEDRAEMLAHHWSSALAYAPADGELAEEFRTRARHALVEAGDRALGLNAIPAAVALYDQALGLTGGEPEPNLLLRFGRSLYLDGDERAAEVLGRARDTLAAAGDASGEAYAEAMLSHVEWSAGDADASTRRVARAVTLIESEPPSEMKARVIARAASRAMLANRNEESVRLGREALGLAEDLGLADLRVNVLTTVGSARSNLGEHEGLDDLQRAYELGLAANTPEVARTALNLGVAHFLLGNIERYAELHADGLRISERFADRPLIRFAHGSQSSLDFFTGNWDAGVASADAFIAACEAAPHYQEPHARAMRAAMRFARDDVKGALADIDRALAGATDPQSQGPAFSVGSWIFFETGDPRATATALHVLTIQFGTTPEPVSSALLALTELPPEVEGRLREVIASFSPGASRWVDAARAALDERFLDAAEIYAGMPFRPAEALARARAAEALIESGRHSEAETQLGLALDFWRSVGATRHIRSIEAMRERNLA